MAGKLLAHLRHQWIGVIALILVLTGGTALATHPGGQNTISTADIINGEVKVADIGQGAVATEELANGEVRSADIGANQVTADELGTDSVGAPKIADGQVRSPELGNGQVQAEDLAPGVAPGASGARAWGLVRGFDGALLRSKQVTSVSHPQTGIYCIDPAPGIDPDSAVMLVAQDNLNDTTSDGSNNVSHAEWVSVSPFCPAQAMQVTTWEGDGRPGDFGEIDSGGFDLVVDDQGFVFAIP